MRLKLSAVASLALLLAACHSQDPDVVGQPGPVQYTAIHQGASSADTITADPQVDILFVIDDSNSMLNHQELLQQNVHSLVQEIAATNAIDFHIGVAQIWDSQRYGPIVPPTCPGPSGTTHVNYIGDGALLPLKAPAGQNGTLKQFSGPFVTNQPGYEAVLEASLLIGEQDLIKGHPGKPVACESGPEVEEILPPIWFSFQPETAAKFNGGFWRQGSLKVFIVLSDAKEGSTYTADYVDSQIRGWLGVPALGPQNAYRVYVAGMVPGTRISNGVVAGGSDVQPDCKPDPGWGIRNGVIPEGEIASLARLSGGKMLSICSRDYGTQLGNFGDEIKRATLQDKRQKLTFPPDMNNSQLPADKRFRLTFSGQTLPEGSLSIDPKTGEESVTGGDWAFDPEHNEVVVRGNFWEDHPKAVIDIVYVPVTSPGAKTN